MKRQVPDFEEWNIKQKQVCFALTQFSKNLAPRHTSYIAYHYGDCLEVIAFARFFEDFWHCFGQYIEGKDFFDLVDEKFIEWIDIMQFEEMCEVMNMDFDRVFKRFMYGF